MVFKKKNKDPELTRINLDADEPEPEEEYDYSDEEQEMPQARPPVNKQQPPIKPKQLTVSEQMDIIQGNFERSFKGLLDFRKVHNI